jgi:hypothetical protein
VGGFYLDSDSITDAYMKEMLKETKSYSFVLLRATAKREQPGADQIIWEQGRRNFELRKE